MKKKKIDIRLNNYFLCDEKRKVKGGEIGCGKLFFNDDDNVCVYCGSKNTDEIFQFRLKGEILDYHA